MDFLILWEIKIMENYLFDNDFTSPIKQTDFVFDKHVILKESTVVKDEYTDYIAKAFDLTIDDTSCVEIPNHIHLENIKDWNVGIICGASGSGKSTILKELGGGQINVAKFDNTKALISNFDNMTPQEATMLLSSMGLASVPTWIRPYNVLSNGEKYRAELAKIVSEAKNDIILIDEYTSVVDRNVAMSMSNALQKYIRKHNKKIILATCHYDIFEWIRPDWIYDLNKGGAFERCDYLRREQPKIELQVYRTTNDTWGWFKKHHYMTQDLNKACACFVFTWNNRIVGFYSVLPFPNGSISKGVRGHRLVVLPDFQGFGIGSKISEFIAGIYKSKGYTLYCKTINPRLGKYRENKKTLWKPSSTNGKKASEREVSKEHNMMGGLTRPSYCHQYIGNPIFGFEDLLKPIDLIRKEKSNKGQLTLF